MDLTYLVEDWGYNIFEDLAELVQVEGGSLHHNHVVAGARIDTPAEPASLMHLTSSRNPGKT